MSAELCWPGVPSPLRLGKPVVTLEADPAARTAHPDATWWQEASAWVWSDGLVRLRVATEPAPPPQELACRLRLELKVLHPVRVRRCWVTLEIPCSDPPYCVDQHLVWRPLWEPVHLGEHTPLVLSWRDAGRGADLRATRGWCAAELAWHQGAITVRLCLDAAALHPRWTFVGGVRSEAAPRRDRDTGLGLDLLLQPAAGPFRPPAVPGRLPGGAEAAFTITDHCDFDTIEAVQAFLSSDARARGWLGRGLRLTKGVFTLPSRPANRAPAPSLAEPGYRALACQLDAEGSEIAPHGLNEVGPIDHGVFSGALAAIARDFRPRTWIDHGVSLQYCYSMGGAAPDSYDLLGALRRAGITVLWAYHDAPTEPAESLNLLAPLRGARTHARLVRGHLARRDWLVAAHYLRSTGRDAAAVTRLQPTVDAVLGVARDLYMHLREGRPAAQVLQRALHGARRVGRALLATLEPPPHGRAELLALAPVLYPERAVPARDTTADEPLLFATQEVVHTADAYRPDALQRLIAERGLHIGHCYLANRLPYLAGVFDPTPGSPRLGRPWLGFLDALEAAVRSGSLWNPCMGELAEWLRALQLVAVVPVAPSLLRLENPLPRTLHGFTLLLPNDVEPGTVRWADGKPAGWRRWDDWLVVWGDLPAASTAVVRW